MKQFSESALMDRLVPGVIYPVSKVAKWFGIETNEARHYLEGLWRNGVLRRRKCTDETWGFQRRPEPFVAEPAEPLDMSIAAPAAPPDMKSTMTDYEREMRRHVELCMSIRR